MPKLTTALAASTGTTEAQPNTAMMVHTVKHVDDRSTSRSLNIPFTPIAIKAIASDGGGRNGIADTRIPFMFFSGSGNMDRRAFFEGDDSRHRPPFLRYFSGRRAGLGSGANSAPDEMQAMGLCNNWTRVNPAEAGRGSGPGPQGQAVVHYLLGRSGAGGLPPNRAALESEMYDSAFRLRGTGSEYAQRQFMKTQESYNTGPVTQDGVSQSTCFKMVHLESMARRYNELIRLQSRWTPWIEPQEIVYIGQYAMEGNTARTNNQYVQLKAPAGRQQINSRYLATLFAEVNGNVQHAAARRVAPHYNILLECALTLNRFFPGPQRMSTGKLVGYIGAQLLAFSTKIGLAEVMSINTDDASSETSFEAMAQTALEFLPKPWAEAFDDLDPATVSRNLEFQEALMVYNFVFGHVARNIGIPTMEIQMIMPDNLRTNRLLEDFDANQKPDVGWGASSLPYNLLSPINIAGDQRARGYHALSISDRTWCSVGNRTERCVGTDYSARWYGSRDHKTLTNMQTLSLVNGKPASTIDLPYYDARVVVQRTSTISEGSTEFTQYRRMVVPRSRLGSFNWNATPVGQGLETDVGVQAQFAVPPDPNLLSDEQIQGGLTFNVVNAEGFFAAWFIDAAGGSDMYYNTSPQILQTSWVDEFGIESEIWDQRGWHMFMDPTSVTEAVAVSLALGDEAVTSNAPSASAGKITDLDGSVDIITNPAEPVPTPADIQSTDAGGEVYPGPDMRDDELV